MDTAAISIYAFLIGECAECDDTPLDFSVCNFEATHALENEHINSPRTTLGVDMFLHGRKETHQLILPYGWEERCFCALNPSNIVNHPQHFWDLPSWRSMLSHLPRFHLIGCDQPWFHLSPFGWFHLAIRHIAYF